MQAKYIKMRWSAALNDGQLREAQTALRDLGEYLEY